MTNHAEKQIEKAASIELAADSYYSKEVFFKS